MGSNICQSENGADLTTCNRCNVHTSINTQYLKYVDLVNRGRVLYLNLRIMPPFCASHFYVYLTREPGEGIADTLGNLVSATFLFF